MLSRPMHRALGLDVGGTNSKLVLVDAAGVVVARQHAPTPSASVDALVAHLRAAVARLVDAHGPVSRVGVATPGLVRPGSRVVHWMQGRMAVVQGLDWTAALDWPRPVPVLNDAQAALIGEAWMGAGQGVRDLVMLTLGTGVGGAVLTDGRLVTGQGGRGGHLGHVTIDVTGPPDIVGTPGSLEDAIGDCTVGARSGGRFTTTAALVTAYRAGDPFAADVWHASVQRLAAAIASFVNVFDPARVILGGGIAAHAWEAIEAPLQRWLDAYEWRPDGVATPIVPARLGDEAGAIGAARAALADVTPNA